MLLTYDITKRKSFEDLAQWHAEVVDKSSRDVIIILVGNMKDLEA